MTERDMERELATRIENPAWDFVKTVPHDDLLGYARSGFTPQFYGGLDDPSKPFNRRTFRFYRDYVTRQFTWAIPSPESIAYIVNLLDGRPVVEIGAGSGYWAWLLAQSGVDINAYDIAPVGHKDSWFSADKADEAFRDQDHPPIEIKEFYPVYPGGPEMLDAEDPHRVLMLVWPTYDSAMAAESLKHYKGDTVIFVGEGTGGCTADPEFFALVGESCCCWPKEACTHEDIEPLFEHVDTGPLTQWSGIHDQLFVYRRITHD